MPSPYDVIVVGSGPAGGTAARYAARRGLKVLLVDKRKEIGVPVQCGEYVAHNEEIRSIFPDVEGLEDLMAVPYHVREVDTPVIRIWSPKGRRYEVPFKGFTVRRDRMDQGIAAQAVDEGAEIMTETTVVGHFIPLSPFFFVGSDVLLGAFLAVLLSGVALFGIGWYEAKITVGSWWREGLEMLVIGLAGGVAGYVIGRLVGAA